MSSETKPSVATDHASDQNIVIAAKGGGIAFFGNLFVYAVRFVFGLLMARMLGAELLGVYSLSLTVTSVLGTIALLGLGTGLSRYIPIIRRHKDDARMWGIIQVGFLIPSITGTLLVIGLFLLADRVALLYLEPRLAPVLRIASFDILLFSYGDLLTSITQGFKHMEYRVLAQDVALNLSKLVLSILAVWLGFGVLGVTAAHIVASVISVILLIYCVNKLFPLRRPLDSAKRGDVLPLLRFSLPLYLSRLVGKFSGSIETVVLGFFKMSKVGVYTTALRLSGIGDLFHSALREIAVPLISELYSQKQYAQLNRVYQTLTKWGMTFNLPIFLMVVLFAEPLLRIFGDDFVAGATGLIILSFLTLFDAATGVCGSLITMTGYAKLTFINSIIYLIVNVLLDIFFIPRFDVLGAAIAVTLAGIFINTLRVIQVTYLLKLWPYNWTFVKPLVAAVIAFGCAYGCDRLLNLQTWWLEIPVGTLVLWVVYGVILVVLRLSSEDMLILERMKARFKARFS